jgi:hypothetical protein
MLATTFPLFLVAFGGGVSAQILARLVDQTISERAARPAGGLALTPEKLCSNDLLSCNSGSFCCPTSLTCTNLVGSVATCCPAGKKKVHRSVILILLFIEYSHKLTYINS